MSGYYIAYPTNRIAELKHPASCIYCEKPVGVGIEIDPNAFAIDMPDGAKKVYAHFSCCRDTRRFTVPVEVISGEIKQDPLKAAELTHNYLVRKKQRSLGSKYAIC